MESTLKFVLQILQEQPHAIIPSEKLFIPKSTYFSTRQSFAQWLSSMFREEVPPPSYKMRKIHAHLMLHEVEAYPLLHKPYLRLLPPVEVALVSFVHVSQLEPLLFALNLA